MTQPIFHKNERRFKCQPGCGECCRGSPGYVWVNSEEARRIAQFLNIMPEEFESRFLRSVNERRSLVERRTGECIFLDEHRCQIYSQRPLQYQMYPFWPEIINDPKCLGQETMSCPGINQGRLYSFQDIERLLERVNQYRQSLAWFSSSS